MLRPGADLDKVLHEDGTGGVGPRLRHFQAGIICSPIHHGDANGIVNCYHFLATSSTSLNQATFQTKRAFLPSPLMLKCAPSPSQRRNAHIKDALLNANSFR
jgi:hypothetical protein